MFVLYIKYYSIISITNDSIMKKINIVCILIISIILTSCSLNKITSLLDKESNDKKEIIKQKKSTKTLCPVTKIPYSTSVYKENTYSNKYQAKLRKVVSGCKFIILKNNNEKNQILINFQAYIDIKYIKKPIKDPLDKLNMYIAIVDNQGKLLTKLLAPIRTDNIKQVNKNILNVVKDSKFKFTYDKKYKDFFIYYGFQK